MSSNFDHRLLHETDPFAPATPAWTPVNKPVLRKDVRVTPPPEPKKRVAENELVRMDVKRFKKEVQRRKSKQAHDSSASEASDDEARFHIKDLRYTPQPSVNKRSASGRHEDEKKNNKRVRGSPRSAYEGDDDFSGSEIGFDISFSSVDQGTDIDVKQEDTSSDSGKDDALEDDSFDETGHDSSKTTITQAEKDGEKDGALPTTKDGSAPDKAIEVEDDDEYTGSEYDEEPAPPDNELDSDAAEDKLNKTYIDAPHVTQATVLLDPPAASDPVLIQPTQTEEPSNAATSDEEGSEYTEGSEYEADSAASDDEQHSDGAEEKTGNMTASDAHVTQQTVLLERPAAPDSTHSPLGQAKEPSNTAEFRAGGINKSAALTALEEMMRANEELQRQSAAYLGINHMPASNGQAQPSSAAPSTGVDTGVYAQSQNANNQHINNSGRNHASGPQNRGQGYNGSNSGHNNNNYNNHNARPAFGNNGHRAGNNPDREEGFRAGYEAGYASAMAAANRGNLPAEAHAQPPRAQQQPQYRPQPQAGPQPRPEARPQQSNNTSGGYPRPWTAGDYDALASALSIPPPWLPNFCNQHQRTPEEVWAVMKDNVMTPLLLAATAPQAYAAAFAEAGRDNGNQTARSWCEGKPVSGCRGRMIGIGHSKVIVEMEGGMERREIPRADLGKKDWTYLYGVCGGWDMACLLGQAATQSAA